MRCAGGLAGVPDRLHLSQQSGEWNTGVPPADCISSAIYWGGRAPLREFVGMALAHYARDPYVRRDPAHPASSTAAELWRRSTLGRFRRYSRCRDDERESRQKLRGATTPRTK